MKLIPVIDIKNAEVVTAKSGKRHAYAPSDTPLCHSSQPLAVISTLLALHPFDTFYIADLDAISEDGSNLTLIQKLHLEHPGITLWVDNGLTELDPLCDFARPVIGTESLTDCDRLRHLVDTLPSPILSLDYLADQFTGPAGLDQQPARWPAEVILMTLSRVGSASGPDTAHLKQLVKQSPNRHFFAAGGVRHLSDLEQLHASGAAGVLLSTALHQGWIGPTELGLFSKP
ncbi:MAG: nickel transporter [Candidatus Thiodiazotropha sp. (ex Rostrolucina anterorostrata)]|nr:nickel transporter [Candidatus Thiodiazotropha sp. (ex Rostrolucina anterorostrata)]